MVFKGLKSLASNFVEFENDKPQPAAANTAQVPVAPPTTISAPLATRTVVTSVGSVDAEIESNIYADIDAATPADLVNFYSLVESFSNLPTDEMRFQTAYIAYQKQGGKHVSELVSGMDVRKKALDGIIASFNTDIKTEKAKVDGVRKQADDLDVQMQKLSEQIVQIKSKKSKLLNDASESEQSLADSQATFLATADSVRAALNVQCENLVRYLSPAQTTTQTQTTTPRTRKVPR